jgi:hypothetical protein
VVTEPGALDNYQARALPAIPGSGSRPAEQCARSDCLSVVRDGATLQYAGMDAAEVHRKLDTAYLRQNPLELQHRAGKG